MHENINNSEYWDSKYYNNQDGWNTGAHHPTLEYLLQRKWFCKPNDKVLFIGAGKGHDALYAAKNDCSVTANDFSEAALQFINSKAEEEGLKIELNSDNLLDFSGAHLNKYQIVFEYTTFCAVLPENIEKIVCNLAKVLTPNGKLITVLFPLDDRKGGPPFNIDFDKFITITKKYFDIEYFQRNIPSIKPRKNIEVLLVFRKK